MTRLKIGIIGCGAIGKSLAKFISRSLKTKAELAALFDIDSEKAENLSKLISRKNLAVKSMEQLVDKSSLIIESASANVSWIIAKKALTHRRDILIMSVGGIAGRMPQLSDLAGRYHAKVYIPSGAVCGIDGLKASGLAKIKQVILTTIKAPLAFKGVRYIEDKNIRLEGMKKDKVLFNGPASEAVKYFPQNINVAGILSIAGIGLKKTFVKIIASPSVKRNIHEIRIDSDAGSIWTRTENVLHPDNPKTSFLAVLSAMAVLKQILEPVQVGA